MFNKFKLTAVALAIVSSQASATDIVFDPTNFTRNVITAAQTAKSTAILASQYATQVKQYMGMVQDLKSMNPAVIAAGVAKGYIPKGTYGDTKEVFDAAQGVYGAYGSIQDTMSIMTGKYSQMNSTIYDISRVANQTGTTVERVMQYENERARTGQQVGRNYSTVMQNLNDSLLQNQARAQALAAQIPQNSGTVDSLATLATQNTLISDQMTHLIEVGTVQASVANNAAKQAADDAYQQSISKNAGGMLNKTTSGFFGSGTPK